jgi:hypothetical protein
MAILLLTALLCMHCCFRSTFAQVTNDIFSSPSNSSGWNSYADNPTYAQGQILTVKFGTDLWQYNVELHQAPYTDEKDSAHLCDIYGKKDYKWYVDKGCVLTETFLGMPNTEPQPANQEFGWIVQTCGHSLATPNVYRLVVQDRLTEVNFSSTWFNISTNSLSSEKSSHAVRLGAGLGIGLGVPLIIAVGVFFGCLVARRKYRGMTRLQHPDDATSLKKETVAQSPMTIAASSACESQWPAELLSQTPQPHELHGARQTGELQA